MISVDHWNAESGIDAKLIMQVHDELVLEVAEAAVEEDVGRSGRSWPKPQH